jgi:uncharacterized protein
MPSKPLSTKLPEVTGSFAQLAARVEKLAPLAKSADHGIAHWQAVARSGLLLAGEVEGADVALVLLFGLLHDCQRVNEWNDPEHGPRAGAVLADLRKDGSIILSDERAQLLTEAMALHDAGQVSEDPTIGCCWDADRLQLSRVGITPRNDLLSTDPARTEKVQTDTEDMHFQQGTWESIGAQASQLARAVGN